MAWTHAGHVRERLKPQVSTRIFKDVKSYPVDRPGGPGLSSQGGAELRLATGAFQEDDEATCHPQRECAPMIFLDQYYNQRMDGPPPSSITDRNLRRGSQDAK